MQANTDLSRSEYLRAQVVSKLVMKLTEIIRQAEDMTNLGDGSHNLEPCDQRLYAQMMYRLAHKLLVHLLRFGMEEDPIVGGAGLYHNL